MPTAETAVFYMLALFALIVVVPVYRSWREARRRADAAQPQSLADPSQTAPVKPAGVRAAITRSLVEAAILVAPKALADELRTITRPIWRPGQGK